VFVSCETHIVADVSYIIGQVFLQSEVVAVVCNILLAFNIVLYTENVLHNDQLIRLSVHYINTLFYFELHLCFCLLGPDRFLCQEIVLTIGHLFLQRVA